MTKTFYNDSNGGDLLYVRWNVWIYQRGNQKP